MLKVAKGVCFTLKSLNETLLLFTHLTSLCENRHFSLITKLKSNRSPSYLSVY